MCPIISYSKSNSTSNGTIVASSQITEKSQNVSVYPNPVTNRILNIKFNAYQNAKVKIFDVTGKMVFVSECSDSQMQTLRSVALQSGGKFVYSQVTGEVESAKIKEALDLLTMAGLIVPVTHTAASGLPLGAEINPKFRKFLFLDTGLLERLLDLDMKTVLLSSETDLVNKGSMSEVFVGLELLKNGSPYERRELYYWLSLKKVRRRKSITWFLTGEIYFLLK